MVLDSEKLGYICTGNWVVYVCFLNLSFDISLLDIISCLLGSYNQGFYIKDEHLRNILKMKEY